MIRRLSKRSASTEIGRYLTGRGDDRCRTNIRAEASLSGRSIQLEVGGFCEIDSFD